MRQFTRFKTVRAALVRGRRFRRDLAGTSMISTVFLLPVLVVIMLAIWHLFVILFAKQALHHGVIDATNQIEENARYWDIDIGKESGVTTDWPDFEPGMPMPADWYDIEARRVVTNRIRDVYNYTHDELAITATLKVTVTEPLLAYAPGAIITGPIEAGFIEALCDPDATADQVDTAWRSSDNIRFMVYAEFQLPAWPLWGVVHFPFTDAKDVKRITLRDRAIGYVQCPRWRGKGREDKSKTLAREGPFMVYRTTATPYYPTVTPYPSDTPAPTNTPMPTVTLVPTP